MSDDTWTEAEYEAVRKVLASGQFTMGERVKEFERSFADKFGVHYAIMSNSGSSANLLAVAAMVYSGKLSRGDEVIVPAVSWSTTYFPLSQMGLKLVFVDINPDTLNIDVENIQAAISDRTKLVVAVNLLGNPCSFQDLIIVCNRNNLLIMEDNCESMGARYQEKYSGTIGIVGTFSTFYSHHLCTMEGGMTVTDDEDLYHYMLSIRAHGWTRNLPSQSKIYSKSEDPFYESFNFIMPGFNLRPLEIEAAAGIEQLSKLDGIIEQRRKNAHYFQEQIESIKGVRIQKEIAKSSWFGFALILSPDLDAQRRDVTCQLSNAEIEVRPIVAGNFTRNSVISYLEHRIVGSLVNADDIHQNGFFVGNHSRDNRCQIDHFIHVLKKALHQ